MIQNQDIPQELTAHESKSLNCLIDFVWVISFAEVERRVYWETFLRLEQARAALRGRGALRDRGSRPVRLPEHPEVPLWLVVVRGLGEQPMMLLTYVRLRNRAVLVNAMGQCRGLLRRRGARNPDQARRPGQPPAPGGQAPLRHPRLPPLRPRRRHPGGLRQIATPLETRRYGPAAAHLPIQLKFLGNVLI